MLLNTNQYTANRRQKMGKEIH